MILGEFGFIDRLLKPLAAGFPGALSLEDDAALVDVPPGQQLVIAKDAMVADVHFLANDPPALVAAKLLRVNLSDLAAMGASPLAYLTVIARPPGLPEEWLRAFVAGLAKDQSLYGLHLIGGDTVSTPGPLTLTLTILGLVPTGSALRRRGAVAGDLVVVSGTLGDAALGLRIQKGLAASEEEALPLIDRYRLPRPRLALGAELRGLASAAIDVSDGLLADLGHILDSSAVGAVIEAARLPLSEAAKHLPAARESALTGGDDYELLFTLPPQHAEGLPALAERLQLRLTPIGRIVAHRGLQVLDEHGEAISVGRVGWRHF